MGLFGQIVAGILAGAALLVALGVIGKSVWWFWKRVLRPLALLIDDWQGEPARPGVDGRPGVLEQLKALFDLFADFRARLTALEELPATVAELGRRLAAVEQQLRPNGGSSLRDAVDALSGPPRERPTLEATAGVQAERADAGQAEQQLVYGFRR